jgi:hypothetical protein
MSASMTLTELFRDYRDGDEQGWDVEFEWLWECHAGRLMMLLDSIEANGILKPITLGPDGRVWDGHHRLCVAWKLGLDRVPVEHATN